MKHRPKTYRPNHPVFPKGVPRARTLRLDLEKAGIPYQDEMGRYADFHSLRYTWGTYLQRNGVNSRVARELMRHSDRKLTDKIYTDSNLLPLGEVVRNLPDEENLIEILTEIPGKTCRNGSRVCEIKSLEKKAQTAIIPLSDCNYPNLATLKLWGRRRKSNPRGKEENPKNKGEIGQFSKGKECRKVAMRRLRITRSLTLPQVCRTSWVGSFGTRRWATTGRTSYSRSADDCESSGIPIHDGPPGRR